MLKRIRRRTAFSATAESNPGINDPKASAISSVTDEGVPLFVGLSTERPRSTLHWFETQNNARFTER